MMAIFFRGLKPPHSIGPNACGTTLIELIVSILVFSVVMLGGMSFFTLGQNSEQRANWIDFAQTVALTQQQNFLADSWYELQNLSENPYVTNPISPAPAQRQFCCSTTVSFDTYGSMQIANLHTVVTWDGQPAWEVVDFDTQISSPVVAQAAQ